MLAGSNMTAAANAVSGDTGAAASSDRHAVRTRPAVSRAASTISPVPSATIAIAASSIAGPKRLPFGAPTSSSP